MNVLLIGINSKYIHPALAIYQLKENLNYDFVNATTKEFTIKDDALNIINYINDNSFSLVCFSVYIWNVKLVKEILQFYKNTPHKFKICLGGPEVSFEFDDYLEQDLCDYIIRGEGEIPFNELVSAIYHNTSLYDVSNLSFKENNTIIKNKEKIFPLDNIKRATLSVHDYQNRVVYLEASRGCPFKCSYCLASTSNNVRFFNLDDIKYIIKKLIDDETKIVKFLDRTFNARPEYTKEIIQYINDHNKKTSFQFEIVVDRLTPELIDLITNANNFPIRFEVGIQTMNESVNKAINRYQNNDTLIKNIAILNNLEHVDLHLDLIAGLPLETLPMFIDSFNKVFKLNAKELQLGFLKCLKGTLISKQKELHEYTFSNSAPYEVINNKYMSKNDLDEIHLVEESLDLFYNSNRFNHTFKYFITKYNDHNFYYFLLDLSNYLMNEKFDFHKYQLYDLYYYFYLFMQRFNDEELLFLIKKDYLLNNKTKPKRWWGKEKLDEEMIKCILAHIDNKTIDDIYRYSIVIKNKKHLFIIFYQNYQPQHFEFDV